MSGNEPKTQLLERVETWWGVIQDALYNPEEWEDEEWTSTVMDLGALYGFLRRIQPGNPEEEARFQSFLGEIREAARTFGFTPPPQKGSL